MFYIIQDVLFYFIKIKIMIKVIDLQNPLEVVNKLNEWKENGWNLNNVYNQIVPISDGTFQIYYDEKLDLK